MSELEHFLAQQLDMTPESGEFTLDPQRAQNLVVQFTKLYPYWGFIKLFQAFVLGDCDAVDVQIRRDSIKVEVKLTERSQLHDGSKILAALQRGEFAETALGSMVSALLALASEAPKSLRLKTPTGTLVFDQGWTFGSGTISNALILELRPNWSRLGLSTRRFRLLDAIYQMCQFYLLPLCIDSKPLVSRRRLDLPYLCKMSVEGEGIKSEMTSLECYEETQPGIYLYSRDAEKLREKGLSHPCTVLWKGQPSVRVSRVLKFGANPKSFHKLLRHGVVIDTIPLGASLSWIRRADLGVEGASDVSFLSVDASGVRVVRNEAWSKFLKDFWADVLWTSERYLEHHDIERSYRLRDKLLKSIFLWPLHRLSRNLSKTSASVFSLQAAKKRHESLELLAKESLET